MLVDLITSELTSVPGQFFDVILDVQNTGTVIDSYHARVLGVDPAWVIGMPDRVAMFPETREQLRMRVTLPRTFPSGRRDLQIEVFSENDPDQVETITASMVVIENSAPAIAVRPAAITTRRAGIFTIDCTNTGNAPTSLSFTAFDPEQVVSAQFEPTVVDIEPGASVPVSLSVRCRPRPLGSLVSRNIDIRANSPGLQLETRAIVNQRPLIPGGAVTGALLVLVLLLWAGGFIWGITSILGDKEDRAKQVAERFYDPLEPEARDRSLDLTTVGASAQGTVVGADGTPVPRVRVVVYRSKAGKLTQASAAASDDEGQYEVGPLVPGGYILGVDSDGYKPTYFSTTGPVDNQSDATPVRLSAAENPLVLDDFEVEGLPGSISGAVDTGSSGSAAGIDVTVRRVESGIVTEPPVTRLATDADGAYSVPDLPTPATYEVTVANASSTYSETTLRVSLAGGETAEVNTIALSAAAGSIRGSVRARDDQSDGRLLGGATITARLGDQEFSTNTPTSGATGSFELARLPAPATYVVSVELDGFTSETIVIDLGAGEDRRLDVLLSNAITNLSGSVLGTTGDEKVPLDGATVRLQGKGLDTTIAADGAGLFTFSGLDATGVFQLTASAEGYVTRTVTVDVSTQSTVGLELDGILRDLVGRVVDGSGSPRATVRITAYDGDEIIELVTATEPAGTFRLRGVHFGTLAVVFGDPDRDDSISISVEVSADDPATIDLGDIAFTGDAG